MIRPTPRYVVLAGAGLLPALLPALLGGAWWGTWFAYVVLVVLAGGADLLFGLLPRNLRLQLRVPDALYMGGAAVATLWLRAPRHRRSVRVEALLELGPLLQVAPAQQLTLPPGGEATASFDLVPRARGMAPEHSLWLRWSGPLGLVEFVRREVWAQSVAIVPNTPAVRRAALRFQASRAFQHGLKAERFIGEGSEFESLREYVPGLDARGMHWKASARHHKLICQDFRAERNHPVVLAFDCGRLMREPLDGIPKLDHAVNAGLLLAFCCLRSGDRVALFAFDEKVRLWAGCRGGFQALHHLQIQMATLQYSSGETNFTLGLAELSLRLQRRALIVLMTDFVDTLSAELMVENLGRLRKRHVVLCVALRDPRLDAVATAVPADIGALHRAVVAGDLVRDRDLVLKTLQRRGVQCLDAAPQHLSMSLINRYLEIKRRELV